MKTSLTRGFASADAVPHTDTNSSFKARGTFTDMDTGQTANCMEDSCGEARDKLLPSLAGYHGTTRVFQCVYFIYAEINKNHPHPKQEFSYDCSVVSVIPLHINTGLAQLAFSGIFQHPQSSI